MSYASQTSVSAGKSQDEIKSTLRRYGVDEFGVLERKDAAIVQFVIDGLCVQITVPMPAREDAQFTQTPAGRERSESAAYKAWEQEVRSRWRRLLLAIKAKLEAVETGISTIEQEFLAFVVLSNGRTVGDELVPRLQAQAERGETLALPSKGGD